MLEKDVEYLEDGSIRFQWHAISLAVVPSEHNALPWPRPGMRTTVRRRLAFDVERYEGIWRRAGYVRITVADWFAGVENARLMLV